MTGWMIDWDRIRELRAEVGEEDFAVVVEMFFEEVDEALGRLFRPGSDALAEDLHFIKGSALNIGLSEVSNMCRLVESKLREAPAVDGDLCAIQAAFYKAWAEFASTALE